MADDNKGHPYLPFFSHGPHGKHKNHGKRRSDLPGWDKKTKKDEQKFPKEKSQRGDGERVAKVRTMSCRLLETR